MVRRSNNQFLNLWFQLAQVSASARVFGVKISAHRHLSIKIFMMAVIVRVLSSCCFQLIVSPSLLKPPVGGDREGLEFGMVYRCSVARRRDGIIRSAQQFLRNHPYGDRRLYRPSSMNIALGAASAKFCSSSPADPVPA